MVTLYCYSLRYMDTYTSSSRAPCTSGSVVDGAASVRVKRAKASRAAISSVKTILAEVRL